MLTYDTTDMYPCHSLEVAPSLGCFRDAEKAAPKARETAARARRPATVAAFERVSKGNEVVGYWDECFG